MNKTDKTTTTGSRTVASKDSSLADCEERATSIAAIEMAKEMFRRAGIKATRDEAAVLGSDINELWQELGDEALLSEAGAELRTRIGGYKNLRSYVDCLLVS